MSEWNEIRLGDLCTFISRGITPQYVDVGTPVINQKCIRNNKVDLSLCKFTDTTQKIKNEKYVEYGDILINSTGAGTLGRVAIYKHHLDSVSADGHVTILHTKGNVNSAYLGYYLHSIEPLIENLGRGSTNQMELSPTDLKRIKIVLPCLDTQKRIAEILSAYDDLIENNNRRIALLEKAAQELYKEWFVRFRFPGYENAKFENGLPEGWNVKRLAEYGKVETGKTPSTEVLENYGCEIMFVKTPDMHGNLFTIQTGEYLSKQGHLTQPKKLLPSNSIMVSCIGTGGVVSINAEQAHTNQQINSIILDNSMFLEWLFFTCKALKETIELFGSTGATMTNLSKGKFEKLKVIEPQAELITLFHDKVYPIFDEIKALMYNNKNLAKQRDLLLPRLMSGKLEV